MKVEKISDSQVKFTVSHSDLRDRDIRLDELAFGTDKIMLFFREMMEQALRECGFESDAPLMIEAAKLSADTLAIIVTKMSCSAEFGEYPRTLKERRQTKTVIDFTPKASAEGTVLLFSFGSLDEAAAAASGLYGRCDGSSALYKDRDRYILLLENSMQEDDGELNAILGEYGQRLAATAMSRHYLNEHSELLIGSGAVDALVKLM